MNKRVSERYDVRKLFSYTYLDRIRLIIMIYE